MKIDYTKLNDFRYNFINKQTGKHSYTIQYCYNNIYKKIREDMNDLKKLCLVGVSNETHEIESVVSEATGEFIYKDEKFRGLE